MALFCKNCTRELDFSLHMERHTILCLGDGRNSGDYEGLWAKALVSPKFMFETYYTTVYPGEYVATWEIEELIEVDNLKERATILKALDHPGVRNSVKRELSNILEKPKQLREFKWREFENRLAISGCIEDPCIFYRKMSTGEWEAVNKSGDPFKAAFSYTNTANYRYWVSSSKAKVVAFGNENSTDAGGVMIALKFKSKPLSEFKIKAHQEKGVQNNPGVVALHREGFAEFGRAIDCDDDIMMVFEQGLDLNLGFTAEHAPQLKKLLLSITKV